MHCRRLIIRDHVVAYHSTFVKHRMGGVPPTCSLLPDPPGIVPRLWIPGIGTWYVSWGYWTTLRYFPSSCSVSLNYSFLGAYASRVTNCHYRRQRHHVYPRNSNLSGSDSPNAKSSGDPGVHHATVSTDTSPQICSSLHGA